MNTHTHTHVGGFTKAHSIGNHRQEHCLGFLCCEALPPSTAESSCGEGYSSIRRTGVQPALAGVPRGRQKRQPRRHYKGECGSCDGGRLSSSSCLGGSSSPSSSQEARKTCLGSILNGGIVLRAPWRLCTRVRAPLSATPHLSLPPQPRPALP